MTSDIGAGAPVATLECRNSNNTLSVDHTGKIIPPIGVIPLEEKLVPICERQPPFQDSYAVTRGRVDISAFKRKLESLPPEYWEDSYQQSRPSSQLEVLLALTDAYCYMI